MSSTTPPSVPAITTPTRARGTLRIAIASDFHACLPPKAGGIRTSFFSAADSIDTSQHHPAANLIELIQKDGLSADLLLSPGDFGDKACHVGIQAAWSATHKIADALKAGSVVGTVGNHDVDSRHMASPYDADGVLKRLSPAFPTSEEATNNAFWARHFSLIVSDEYRLAVLNSSAYHAEGEAELLHGRISDETLTAIDTALKNNPARPVNILLCHHHPQQHMELHLGEKDVMKNGQLLLDLLGSGTHGQWLVIHGHKHHPRVTYAQGSSISPVVFSAGSISAVLYDILSTHVRNQFYIIELPFDLFATYGFVGTFRAWDWHYGVGWLPAQGRLSIPARGGFGFREHHTRLASRIHGALNGQILTWQDFVSLCPEYRFLLPQDARGVEEALTRNHGVRISYDSDHQPTHIGPHS